MFYRGMIVAGSLLLFGCNTNRQMERETAAILQVKQIGQAETMYYSQFGRYAASLAELGPSESGTPTAAAANLISKEAASGKDSSYVFTLQSAPGGYAITAVPETPESGSRTFYSDQTMVIRNDRKGAPAGAASPELK